jgi:hypothetical protein
MTDTRERPDKQLADIMQPQQPPRSEIDRLLLQERDRLITERDGLWDEIKEREERAQTINVEIERIDAYLKFKPGQTQATQSTSREKKADKKPRASSRQRAPRGSSSGLRQQVLDVIRRSPGGMMPNDVIAEMNADDKQAASIRQAIFALSKQGVIRQAGKAVNPTDEAPEPSAA